jgi:hypothetical protein
MKDVVENTKIKYTGGDIVEALIVNNKRLIQTGLTFITLDILADPIPDCDVWLCRDLLFHFPNSAVQQVLDRFVQSKVKYFMTSQFTNVQAHPDIEFGKYRPVNLCCKPFGWPKPLDLIYDGDETDAHRYIGIWRNPRLSDLVRLDA